MKDFFQPQKGKREAFQEMAVEQMSATYNIMLGLARFLKISPKKMVEISHQYIANDSYAKQIAIEEQKYIEEKKQEQIQITQASLWGKIKSFLFKKTIQIQKDR